jgi:hypothetical protein
MNTPFPALLPDRTWVEPVIFWTVADVRDERPDLTARQAWQVFELAISEQHPQIGITWDGLMHAADTLYGPAQGELR